MNVKYQGKEASCATLASGAWADQGKTWPESWPVAGLWPCQVG